jgi:hypothetical protein
LVVSVIGQGKSMATKQFAVTLIFPDVGPNRRWILGSRI